MTIGGTSAIRIKVGGMSINLQGDLFSLIKIFSHPSGPRNDA